MAEMADQMVFIVLYPWPGSRCHIGDTLHMRCRQGNTLRRCPFKNLLSKRLKCRSHATTMISTGNSCGIVGAEPDMRASPILT
ncbi:hypothetical protein E2C01_088725 [Portunus trituberculatus]|uniref:Uncharacterized protein n=1 Tax=Portunus trituberculatus TaxID=210409 RepID=A0A5B7JBI6_PORTR|nr:hypothetical protein [Portunus trituberculatus]